MSRALLTLAALVVFTTAPVGQPPPATLQVFFGNLHSHTAYSDGTGTPAQAYAHAKEAGLDFLLISEHNHAAAEGTGNDPEDLHIATDPELYNGAGAQSLTSAAARMNQQNPGAFVALFGQEFSTNSGGNHVNVFDLGEVIDSDVVPNKDFEKLYGSWLVEHRDSFSKPAIVQLNHPKSFNKDYGMLNYGSLDDLLAAAAPHVRTIEIINGPHDAQGTGHRVDNIKWGSYLQYLNAGFKLSPTADQDNHFVTHGSVTDHRTGLLAATLTKQAVLDAIRARRTYASQDKNLQVHFTINGAPMGATLAAAAATPLNIVVRLHDPDEAQAEYRVSLRRDVVGGEVDARTELAHVDVVGNGDVRFDQFQHTADGEYFLVQIVQNNSTDGADQVWTGPIWVAHQGDHDGDEDDDGTDPGVTSVPPGPPAPPAGHSEEFVWSERSEVYHLRQCRVVPQIAEANRRAGHQPPTGKRLHTGCPQ